MTAVAATPPNVMVAPVAKFVPKKVKTVPPAIAPTAGVILVIVVVRSTI